MIHSRIRRATLALALTLSLLVPSTALAGTQTGAGSETAVVTSALTFSGVAANIDYGTVASPIVQGACASASPFTVTIGNANAGFDLSVQATALSKTGPSYSIPQAQRTAKFSLGGSTTNVTKQPSASAGVWGTSAWTPADCGASVFSWGYGTAETPVLTRTGGGTTTNTTVGVQLGLGTTPADPVGTYSGSITFRFATP